MQPADQSPALFAAALDLIAAVQTDAPFNAYADWYSLPTAALTELHVTLQQAAYNTTALTARDLDVAAE